MQALAKKSNAEFNSSEKGQNLEVKRAAEYFYFETENEEIGDEYDANFIAR